MRRHRCPPAAHSFMHAVFVPLLYSYLPAPLPAISLLTYRLQCCEARRSKSGNPRGKCQRQGTVWVGGTERIRVRKKSFVQNSSVVVVFQAPIPGASRAARGREQWGNARLSCATTLQAGACSKQDRDGLISVMHLLLQSLDLLLKLLHRRCDEGNRQLADWLSSWVAKLWCS